MLSVTPVNNVKEPAWLFPTQGAGMVSGVSPSGGGQRSPFREFPYKLSETPATLRRPAPLLGQDTDAALKAAQSTHEAGASGIPPENFRL